MERTRQREVLFSVAGIASLAASVLAAAGCDAQRTPTDPGVPPDTVASVVGNVVNERTQPVPAAKIVLVWAFNGAMFPNSGTGVDLIGNFPEHFKIDLTAPPDPQWLFLPSGNFQAGYFDLGAESKIAIAHIIAVKQEIDASSFILPTDYVGGAEDWVLVYAADDVAAGTAGAAYFGGPIRAGYHIMSVATIDEANADYAPILACEKASTNLAEWKACGIYTWLSPAPADTTIGVRLVDNESDLPFRPAEPTYLGWEWEPPGCPAAMDPNDPVPCIE